MKIKDIILIFLGACVIGLLVILFTRKNSNELIAAKDETIKAIQRERDSYIEQKENINADLVRYRERDSILNQLFLQNQKLHEEFEKELKNIPANIKRIADNDDAIRAAFKDFN